jgi:predicted SnoaL-like aldol condensation-catalyzing enzyme
MGMIHAEGSGPDKEAAMQFLQLVVGGRIVDAYERYVDMSGKHHNPYYRAGFPALRQAMMEDEGRRPGKQLLIKHALGDGDMVAVHSRLVVPGGESDYAVVHLFRFQKNKIVEMWDLGMPVPAHSPNDDGTF